MNRTGRQRNPERLNDPRYESWSLGRFARKLIWEAMEKADQGSAEMNGQPHNNSLECGS